MERTPQQIAGVKRLKRSERGFTLVELMVSLFILAIVTGAVFEQINQMQKKASSQAAKLDMNQQARDFVDQTVRDLHMAGYPSAAMYSTPPALKRVAAGLVSVSPTQILLEGDVNNDGTVYSVQINYVAADPYDPNCPCIRRSAMPKIEADSFSQNTTLLYTETTSVLPPGQGPGQSGEDLFTYYKQDGTAVPVSGGIDIRNSADTIATIKTVKINLSLLSKSDIENVVTRTSMSATARVN